MVLAIALVLLVLGSLLFHFMSPWYFTPIASNWGAIDGLLSNTIFATGLAFVAVNLFMAYCVMQFRNRAGVKADYEPENKKLEGWLFVLTTLGVAGLLAPGLFAWAKIVDVPKDAQVVEAVGRQWHWMFRFPGQDGKLGSVDPRFVSDANPFGLNPDDPNGQDDILVISPELHLPINIPRKVQLRSVDVLHDFSVPQFRVKMDLVPGLATRLWFTPTQAGTFNLNCQELCGTGHFTMLGRIVVEDDAAFQGWLASYPTFAQSISPQSAGDATAGAALYAVCSSCHGQQGEGNPALHAPKLAGQADWYLVRQINSFKAGLRGAQEKDTYGQTMAPMAATLPDDAAINNVVAYIKTLPDQPAAPTLQTDAGHGRSLYGNCSTCHGNQGQGIRATNAPRLAGMSDWYVATQLNNFRHGVRGKHAKDYYGQQMGSMAAMLPDDRSTADLAGFVNSLR
jgi:cytochrome c oxidase subunit II